MIKIYSIHQGFQEKEPIYTEMEAFFTETMKTAIEMELVISCTSKQFLLLLNLDVRLISTSCWRACARKVGSWST